MGQQAPISAGWMLAVLAAGFLQGLATLRFLWRLRQDSRADAENPHSPSVSVIVPCKGDSPELRGNLESFLGQDYQGQAEFIFVTPREDDPAHSVALGSLAAHPRAEARAVCSGAKPLICSEKNLNLLAGVAAARGDSRILVFADCDLRVEPSWLSGMVGPLRDPATTAAVCSARNRLVESTSSRICKRSRISAAAWPSCFKRRERSSSVSGASRLYPRPVTRCTSSPDCVR